MLRKAPRGRRDVAVPLRLRNRTGLVCWRAKPSLKTRDFHEGRSKGSYCPGGQLETKG